MLKLASHLIYKFYTSDVEKYKYVLFNYLNIKKVGNVSYLNYL